MMNAKTYNAFHKAAYFTLAICALHGANTAYASDDLSVSVGLRLWNNQWQANSFAPVGGTIAAIHADSSTTLAVIPVMALRYKEFGISFSRFLDRSYTLSDGIQPPFEEKRSESDINFSYAFIPGLSVSIGQKEIQWNEVNIKGPTLGASASAPIGLGFGVYGTGGMGWLKTKAPGVSLDSDYALGEIGLSYSFDTKLDIMKGLTATAGYRFQKVTAKSYAPVNNRDVNDTTAGFVFGLIGRF